MKVPIVILIGFVMMCASACKPDAKMANSDINEGIEYFRGQGVPQDYSEALGCFLRAADQGDADAQFIVGFLYIRGEGVSEDYLEALKWYQKAADPGDQKAKDAMILKLQCNRLRNLGNCL